MTFPILELITQNIETTLKTITVANHYNYELLVTRRSKKGNIPYNLSVEIEQDSPDREANTNANQLGWYQLYNIIITVRPSEDDATPIDQWINLISADCMKALMIDRTRGGYAVETTIEDTPYNPDNENDGLTLVVKVQYRHKLTDPYSLA